MESKFPVSEIFTSIQGEGNYAGVRCLFIRFQFCNLKCSWCDTKYTWLESTGKFRWYGESELKELFEKSDAKHVIFTGGEPAFQNLDRLVVPNKMFHVETNGTIIPTEPLEITLRDGMNISRNAMNERVIENFNWVVSPKLSNSRQEINKEALIFWSKKEFCIFKFIARNENDLIEISQLSKELSIDKSKIYIGIEGISRSTQLQPDFVDLIIKYGFNYSPRLHVLLWGAQREK